MSRLRSPLTWAFVATVVGLASMDGVGGGELIVADPADDAGNGVDGRLRVDPGHSLRGLRGLLACRRGFRGSNEASVGGIARRVQDSGSDA